MQHSRMTNSMGEGAVTSVIDHSNGVKLSSSRMLINLFEIPVGVAHLKSPRIAIGHQAIAVGTQDLNSARLGI